MMKSTTTAAVAAESSATAVYALGRDPAETARLQRQSGELHSASAALLDRTGLRPGRAAIDLGCGPSGIIELLAERVSPGGRVVGLDADSAHVAMAREFACQRGLGNVDIVAADARRTGLPLNTCRNSSSLNRDSLSSGGEAWTASKAGSVVTGLRRFHGHTS